MAPFSKTLKQAEGLISVGQTHASPSQKCSPSAAASTPLASLDPNIAQNTSVQSIEAVITRFVQLVGKLSYLLKPSKTTPGSETIAQQAFKFCLKHNRKVEFRRLARPSPTSLQCRIARQHHLDTRFAQLNTSVELELCLLTPAGAGGKAAWSGQLKPPPPPPHRKTQPPSAEDAARFAGQVPHLRPRRPVGLLSSSSFSQNISSSGSSSSNADPAATRLTARLASQAPHARVPPRQRPRARRPPPRPQVVTQLYTVLEVEFDPYPLRASHPARELCQSEVYSVYVSHQRRRQSHHGFSLPPLSSRTSWAARAAANSPCASTTPRAACVRRRSVVDALEGSAAAAPGEKNKTDAVVQPSVAELVRTRLGSQTKMTTPPAKLCLARRGRPKGAQAHAAAPRVRRAAARAPLRPPCEKEDALQRAESSRREEEDEAKRAKEEARRELERVRKIQFDMKLQDAERYKAALVEKGISAQRPGSARVAVAQLEKEKKELSERLRIVAKRVDRIERAYRKGRAAVVGAGLRAAATDRETFAAIQTQCKEGRGWRTRRIGDEEAAGADVAGLRERRVVVIAKKGDQYAKRKDAAEPQDRGREGEEEEGGHGQARGGLAEKSAPPARKPIVPNPLSGVRAPAVAPATESVWRHGGGSGTPAPSTACHAYACDAGEQHPAARGEPQPAAVPKYVPGALRGGAPAAAAGETSTLRLVEEPPKDDDGFQTVPDKKGVWRPWRGRA
ncbi:hypothetical protein B0H14DRAFT_3883938 [Mycena olivaceomarginata]|nr:hypothetical protein B0H14DRAFT_3883938 [Mycena olivaceomarginata]